MTCIHDRVLHESRFALLPSYLTVSLVYASRLWRINSGRASGYSTLFLLQLKRPSLPTSII